MKIYAQLIAAVLLVALGALAMFGITRVFADVPEPQLVVQSNQTEIINSIEREEQLVLLSLAVQGILERKSNLKFFEFNLPGSDRAAFIQYGFRAKLGIEGKDVKIEKVGEGSYLITVPEFIFIGHDDIEFKSVIEQNGVLSWGTPSLSGVESANEILGDGLQREYLDDNFDLLY